MPAKRRYGLPNRTTHPYKNAQDDRPFPQSEDVLTVPEVPLERPQVQMDPAMCLASFGLEPRWHRTTLSAEPLRRCD